MVIKREEQQGQHIACHHYNGNINQKIDTGYANIIGEIRQIFDAFVYALSFKENSHKFKYYIRPE